MHVGQIFSAMINFLNNLSAVGSKLAHALHKKFFTFGRMLKDHIFNQFIVVGAGESARGEEESTLYPLLIV